MENKNNTLHLKSCREIKKIKKKILAIEALDEKMQALSDEELRAKTCSVNGWYYPASGTYCRDEDW